MMTIFTVSARTNPNLCRKRTSFHSWPNRPTAWTTLCNMNVEVGVSSSTIAASTRPTCTNAKEPKSTVASWPRASASCTLMWPWSKIVRSRTFAIQSTKSPCKIFPRTIALSAVCWLTANWMRCGLATNDTFWICCYNLSEVRIVFPLSLL